LLQMNESIGESGLVCQGINHRTMLWGAGSKPWRLIEDSLAHHPWRGKTRPIWRSEEPNRWSEPKPVPQLALGFQESGGEPLGVFRVYIKPLIRMRKLGCGIVDPFVPVKRVRRGRAGFYPPFFWRVNLP
jgi:hypothetical protein